MRWLRSIFSPPDARSHAHRFVVEALAKWLRTAPAHFENYHPQGSPGRIYTRFRLANGTVKPPRIVAIEIRNNGATVSFNDSVALELVFGAIEPAAELDQIICTIEEINRDQLVVLVRGIMTGEPYGRVPMIDCMTLQSAQDAARNHCQQVLPRDTPFASLISWTGKNDHQFKPPKE